MICFSFLGPELCSDQRGTGSGLPNPHNKRIIFIYTNIFCEISSSFGHGLFPRLKLFATLQWFRIQCAFVNLIRGILGCRCIFALSINRLAHYVDRVFSSCIHPPLLWFGIFCGSLIEMSLYGDKFLISSRVGPPFFPQLLFTRPCSLLREPFQAACHQLHQRAFHNHQPVCKCLPRWMFVLPRLTRCIIVCFANENYGQLQSMARLKSFMHRIPCRAAPSPKKQEQRLSVSRYFSANAEAGPSSNHMQTIPWLHRNFPFAKECMLPPLPF